MTATVSIGEFSRLSHLSVKTLRYYHDIDLLVPAQIDRSSGYRRYRTAQVEQAQLIRRLRDLDMPLPDVRAVLTAPDDEHRNAALHAHLQRMESELRRTQGVVASLRDLLGPPMRIGVDHRSTAALPVVAIDGVVARAEVGEWCATTFPQLYEALGRAGIEPAGYGGATYSTSFFEDESGEVVAYVPVPAGTTAVGGLAVRELPARRFAVAVHSGPFEDFDRTYGALGSHVAEHDVSLAEPIREIYVVGPDTADDPAAFVTEVCWPIHPTTA